MPKFIRKSSIKKIASLEDKYAEIDKEALFKRKEPLEQIVENITRKLREKQLSVALRVEKIIENGDKSIRCEISFPDIFSPLSTREGFKVTFNLVSMGTLDAYPVKKEVLVEYEYDRNFYEDLKIPFKKNFYLDMLENNWSGFAAILAEYAKDLEALQEDKVVTYEDLVREGTI